MTDNIEKYSGVVYFSMNDLSLGFGIASRSSSETKDLEPTAIIGFNQSDIGEYLRVENTNKEWIIFFYILNLIVKIIYLINHETNCWLLGLIRLHIHE